MQSLIKFIYKISVGIIGWNLSIQTIAGLKYWPQDFSLNAFSTPLDWNIKLWTDNLRSDQMEENFDLLQIAIGKD